MRLAPKRPPGRSTRKALAFEAEIRQLRAQGYTFEAIREALAEAGVHVSKSTVQREVARTALVRPPEALASNTHSAGQGPAPRHVPGAIEPPAAFQASPTRTDLRSGKDIAQAFVQGRITNPLLRTRSSDEDSRH